MMNVKPIHTEDDYNAALARVDELWEAAPGTPRGDELEVLAVLIGHYEEKIDSLDDFSEKLQADSIEAISYLMEQRGL
ncbi:MAG: hypothetical protein LBI92_11770 [Azoarcus sp.]|jgi:HTH-type transcriptional regulator/antitoxin HigA|nr:hypothetical protein [Azoarcus sp.]